MKTAGLIGLMVFVASFCFRQEASIELDPLLNPANRKIVEKAIRRQKSLELTSAKLTILINSFQNGTWEEDRTYTTEGQGGRQFTVGFRHDMNQAFNIIVRNIDQSADENREIKEVCQNIKNEREQYKQKSWKKESLCDWVCLAPCCPDSVRNATYDARPKRVVERQAIKLQSVIQKALDKKEPQAISIKSQEVDYGSVPSAPVDADVLELVDVQVIEDRA